MKNILVIFLIFVLPVSAPAEWWVNVGGGIGFGGDFVEPISANVGATRRFGLFLASLRSVYVGDILGDDLTDIGFLLGMSTKSADLLASFSAGLATAIETQAEGGDFLSGIPPRRTKHTTVGFPIEAQVVIRPFDNGSERISTFRDFLNHVGFGVYGFANFNRKSSFGGVNLNLQFGKFKSR